MVTKYLRLSSCYEKGGIHNIRMHSLKNCTYVVVLFVPKNHKTRLHKFYILSVN